MPTRLLVLYGHPTDAAAFDAYYVGTHAPLVKRIPGLRSFTASSGEGGAPAGPAPYHLVGELDFDSLADLQAALGSPEGQAAAGDLQNFATGGATLVWYELRQF
jgi:uncharacterized protein (TIGR02118 family)